MHGFFSRTEAYREEGIRFFFYGIGNCSCSSGIPTRIAIAILGVQSAGFALFYYSDKKLLLCEIRKVAAFFLYEVVVRSVV